MTAPALWGQPSASAHPCVAVQLPDFASSGSCLQLQPSTERPETLNTMLFHHDELQCRQSGIVLQPLSYRAPCLAPAGPAPAFAAKV